MVSGPNELVNIVKDIATILHIPFIKVNSPYPFHSPLLQSTVANFAAKIRHLPQQPLQIPVYSPILQRYYKNEDILTECLAQHLILPVKFLSTVQYFYHEGIQTFIESGALGTLGKLVKKIVNTDQITTVTCLDPNLDDLHSLENALSLLNSQGLTQKALDFNLAQFLLPEANPELFNAFWKAKKDQLRSYIKQKFEAFTQF